jgi:hypothetical protein
MYKKKKQAFGVWPNANVKFNYLEKQQLLSSIPPTQSKDPTTALAQGLDKQPQRNHVNVCINNNNNNMPYCIFMSNNNVLFAGS